MKGLPGGHAGGEVALHTDPSKCPVLQLGTVFDIHTPPVSSLVPCGHTGPDSALQTPFKKVNPCGHEGG